VAKEVVVVAVTVSISVLSVLSVAKKVVAVAVAISVPSVLSVAKAVKPLPLPLVTFVSFVHL